MHRLVQLTTRTWVESHGRLAIWTERCINNLCTAFPIGTYENWDTCGSLFPHVKSALSQRPKLLSLQSRQNWATLLYNSAWYTWKTGKIADMMEMATRSWKERVEILGSEDEDSLESTAVLAIAYEEQGQWKTAEKLNVQVLGLRRAKLGEEHPGTLATMSNLAMIVCDQGRYEEAERLQMQVMETRKTKLGEDHRNTLSCMGNLALTFKYQGRYMEAERFEVQVLEASRKKLGEEHPDTLVSMFNLSWTWKRLGQTSDAIDLLRACLARLERVLGIDHPTTLDTSEALLEWTTQKVNDKS